MAAPQLSSRLPKKIDERVTNDAIRDEVGKKYFGFSDMASGSWAGGEKAQQKVDIAERMRSADPQPPSVPRQRCRPGR